MKPEHLIQLTRRSGQATRRALSRCRRQYDQAIKPFLGHGQPPQLIGMMSGEEWNRRIASTGIPNPFSEATA